MTSLNFPSFFHCTLRFKYILSYCITMHMLFVQHHTFSCVFECCNNTLKAGQQYTGSKLNKKLENFTRGQNQIQSWKTIHEVKTKYETGETIHEVKTKYETGTTMHEVNTKYKARKLYTRSKLNTKLENYTQGQN